ncbi:MAG: Asp-tRNA(Asn)/Glu-tRNA(Gln) amidotransferase subunit GatA [Clostridia bacterium]|nr:Asp-tRNA(Asn)/Glu-tRNA(Gln) amidotransferase subunit GatA [Clostridia bacterium]
MKQTDILELSALLRKKELSAYELTLACIESIEKSEPVVNAFISASCERALERAAACDRKIKHGEPIGLIEGIPFAVKDNICVEGVRTTCGSKMLDDFVSPYTATAVKNLLSEGAILLGKTNMDEFGMGSATDTSCFGATKNPLDTERTAGGSSGGSAAAVASGECVFALGSDTGGSARLPAAFCGLVGIKPTYGSVSRYGLIAFSSSLEQICPLTSSVKDSALIFQILAGKDTHDKTAVGLNSELVIENADIRGMKIGLPLSVLGQALPEVRDCILKTASTLESLGAQVIEVELPSTDMATAAYYVISSAEAASNLARFDGVRYGYAASSVTDIDGLFTVSRVHGFGQEVKRRILLGTYCLSFEGRSSYYKQALNAKRQIEQAFSNIFKECDSVLLPVAPTAAYRFEDKSSQLLDIWRQDGFCAYASLAGLPALTLPMGADGNGMPIGIQLLGKPFSEKTLYKTAYALEETRCKP